VIPSSDLTAMYKSFPVYLWVEDEETRTYLKATWSDDPLIGIYIAGGNEGVHAAVRAARANGYLHVFGFRDRDFGTSNRSRWGNDDVHVFASEAFEIENLLLDSDAIAACDVNTSDKKASDIKNDLRALAAPLVWWMCCRRTITEISDSLTLEFIEHPRRADVTTQQQALDVIVRSPWWASTRPAIAGWDVPAALPGALSRHHATYAAMLASAQWALEFSGKEILRDLFTSIWTKKRPPDPRGRIEFVKSIARAQRLLKRVPQEIADLRVELRGRVGLPP
jgi:hypothetical protein